MASELLDRVISDSEPIRARGIIVKLPQFPRVSCSLVVWESERVGIIALKFQKPPNYSKLRFRCRCRRGIVKLPAKEYSYLPFWWDGSPL